MTAQKPRLHGGFGHALLVISAKLGINRVMKIAEVCKSQVYQWTDDDNPQWPNVHKAALLDAAYQRETGQPGPLGLAHVESAELLSQEVPHEPAPHLDRVRELVRETSEGLQAYLRSDKEELSVSEAAEILKELDEARQAVDGAMKDVKSRTVGLNSLPKRGDNFKVIES